MPISAIMSFISSIVMIGSWLVISQRIRKNPQAAALQVQLLNGFFLMMGLFSLSIALPNILLVGRPDIFPIAMAWGYIIGHVFFYIGLIYIIRMIFSLLPRLANHQQVGVVFGAIGGAVITAITIATMAFGRLPAYDEARGLILYNASPAVGAGIAILAGLTILPTGILLVINGIRNHSARVRSFLLGGGFLTITAGGPLHDVAKTAQLYAIADLISIVGLLLVAAGVMYRYEERIVAAKAVQSPVGQ
jgi:hypothetical protein